MPNSREVRIPVGQGVVSGLLDVPAGAWAAGALAHGAGAGMRHPFLARIASEFGARGIATLRYQFPYMEAGTGRPDPPAVAHAAVRAAVATLMAECPGLPSFAGGKSFGGRMTADAEAGGPLGAAGLFFLGYPLHPPGRPGTDRAKRLGDIRIPMLFLQGTRDEFAGLDLLTGVLGPLGSRATLHVVDGGDHSFAVLKRSGRTADQVFAELADTIAAWARAVAGGKVA